MGAQATILETAVEVVNVLGVKSMLAKAVHLTGEPWHQRKVLAIYNTSPVGLLYLGIIWDDSY
jgi:hypothetical protein